MTTPTQAGAIAEAIRAQVRDQPFRTPAGAARVITVSVGVAMLQAQDQSLEDVLHRADQAVYLAKSQGRDQVVLV